MTAPLVSGLCLTFGRPPRYTGLLEEALYWFVNQEYPNKELVVVNDAPDQELVIDAPGVRVINLAARSRTLAEKYDAALELSRGEIVMSWDDDDVSLPWRMSQVVSLLSERNGRGEYYSYWNPGGSWYVHAAQTGGRLSKTHGHGVLHNAAAYRRRAFTPGYAGVHPLDTPAQDAAADAWLKANVPTHPVSIRDRPELWSYVYRFGVSDFHVSSRADPGRDRMARTCEPGRFVVEPKMHRDWAVEATEAAGRSE